MNMSAAVIPIGNHWREYKYADETVPRASQKPVIYNQYIGFDYTLLSLYPPKFPLFGVNF